MRLGNIWISSMELARGAITGPNAGPNAGLDAGPIAGPNAGINAGSTGGLNASADAAAVAAQLKASLDAAANRAQAKGYSVSDTQLALFAVVAWIDELAMSHPWAGGPAWRLSPLQRHYFATTRAGTEFFEKLESLPEDSYEVREVYGLVLLAGFSGRYTHRPPGELAAYRADLLERIAAQRQMAPLESGAPLFPQAGARGPEVARYRRGLGPSMATFVLVMVPLCALLGLYLYLDYRVADAAAQVTAPTPASAPAGPRS